MLLSQEGYYAGVILDGGFGESSGGYPQEVLMLQAQQVYDKDNDEYVPIDPEGGTDITWYGVLFGGKDKETLNCKQLKKVTGWNGASFPELSAMELTGMPIQFRVEFHTYDGKTSLQVSWIAEEGASPFRSVPKLEAAGVDALQAKYSGILASTRAPVEAASAPSKVATTAPCKDPAKDPPKRKRRTKAEIEAAKTADDAAAAAALTNAATPPANDLPPPTTTTPAKRPTMPAAAVTGTCTGDEAWIEAEAMKRDDISADEFVQKWEQTVLALAPGGIEADATPEDWFKVKQAMLTKTGKV